MMMGTGETNAERIEHLRMIRDVQDRTGGFRSFIPWTYQPENNHLKGRTQATTLEYLRLVAVARLFFDNVAHLQSSWLTTGKDVGQLRCTWAWTTSARSCWRRTSSPRPAPGTGPTCTSWSADPLGGPDPGPARHPLPPPGVHHTPADDPTDERVRSHFSSIALPGGGAGKSLPLVDAH